MRLPIKALKELANKYGYDVVVVYTFEAERKVSHVATWGRTIKQADQAAQWGNMMKDALGWPETLHAMPSRVRNLQKRAADNHKLLQAAKDLLKKIDDITTDQFSQGAERAEREALREAIAQADASGPE